MAILIQHCSTPPEGASLPAHWLAELPPTKRAELVRSRDLRRVESLTGLRLLAHGMRVLGHSNFELSEVRFGRGIKPQTGRGIDFSITHSGGLVACALNESMGQPVGLDVERIRPIDVDSLGKYLGRASQPGSRSVSEIFRLWTRRESVLKAAGGAGLARLEEVEYDSDDAPIAQFDGRRWHTQKVNLGRDFVTHVTTQAEGTEQYSAPVIRVANVTWLELCQLPAHASESAR